MLGILVGVFAALFRMPEAVVWATAISSRVVGIVVVVLVENSFCNQKVSNGLHSNNRTHVKDPKNLVEVQPPGGNRLFVVPDVETSRDRVPSPPLDYLPVNICHNPAVESIVNGGSRHMSLAKLTPTIDLSHHTRTDRLRLVSSHSSLGRALGRRLRKTIRARHDPVDSPPTPSCV